ncbi:MAG: TPR repeat protein/CHAT domain-containing protein [Oleiphilaceae bacterium]|jgi:TPR repeat protein/CHAT domain-containing protein
MDDLVKKQGTLTRITLLNRFIFIFVAFSSFPSFSNDVTPENNQALLESAEQGDSTAQLALGFKYYQGEGVKKDLKQSFYWYLKAAEVGDPIAQLQLGLRLLLGTGVEENDPEGFYWIKQSAENSYQSSYTVLADLYYNGEGTNVDLSKAASWYKNAAEAGFPEAKYQFGLMLLNGEGLRENSTEGFKWVKQAAEDGYEDAYYILGLLYGEGNGTQQNSEYAYIWFRKAAELGVEDAQFEVGVRLLDGTGITENDLEGFYWIKQSAQNSYQSSYTILAELYYKGEGTNVDLSAAATWYEKAAKADSLEAKYQFGRMLINGDGVEQDTTKGTQLLQKAGELGSLSAQITLGDYYFTSSFGHINHNKSKDWYLQAAQQQDDAYVNSQLGWLYGFTEEKWRNWDVAIGWFKKATALKDYLSAGQLFFIYKVKGDTENAEKYIAQAFGLAKPGSVETLELYFLHWPGLIELYLQQNEKDKAKKVYSEFIELSSKFNSHQSEAYEAKHFYYKTIGNYPLAEKSLVDAAALAVTESQNAEYKERLDLFISRQESPNHTEGMTSYAEQLEILVTTFWENWDEDALTLLISKIESPEIVTRADGVSLLLAVEGLVEYFEFAGDYSNSAKYASLFIMNSDLDYFTGLKVAKRLKMEAIAAYPDNYELAIERLNVFSQSSALVNSMNDSPSIEIDKLATSINYKYGRLDKAKAAFESVMKTYLDGIRENGKCFANSGYRPNIYFELTSRDSIRELTLNFVTTYQEASDRFSHEFLALTCSDDIEEFSRLILSLIERKTDGDEEKIWFDFLLTSIAFNQNSAREKASIKSLQQYEIENPKYKELFTNYADSLQRYNIAILDYSNGAIRPQTKNPVELPNETINQAFTALKRAEEKLISKDDSLLNPLKSTFRELSVTTIQDGLQSKEAAITFTSGDKNIHAIVITKKGVKLVPLELDKNQFLRLSNQILKSVSQGSVDNALDIRPFAFAEALQLYQLTMQHIEPHLMGKTKLLIIENSVLPNFPWVVLPRESLQNQVMSSIDFAEYRKVDWFAEDKEITYVTALSLFNKERHPSIGQLGSPAIGFTPYKRSDKTVTERMLSSVQRFMFQGQSEAFDSFNFPELPNTITQLDNFLQKTSANVIDGEQATSNAILKQFSNSDIGTVVFATHALTTGKFSQNPGLIVRSNSGKEFTMLTTQEIMSSHVKNDWIVLLACNTGNVAMTNRMVGLADSFIYAGAKRVVISDWDVEASATERLTSFISDTSEEFDFTLRLSHAQKAMRDDTSSIIYAHPMFWGAFRVIGYP